MKKTLATLTIVAALLVAHSANAAMKAQQRLVFKMWLTQQTPDQIADFFDADAATRLATLKTFAAQAAAFLAQRKVQANTAAAQAAADAAAAEATK